MPCCKNSLGLTWCSIFMKASNSSMKASVSLLLIDSASAGASLCFYRGKNEALSQNSYRHMLRRKHLYDCDWCLISCWLNDKHWFYNIYIAAFQIHIYTHCLIFQYKYNIFIWREREKMTFQQMYMHKLTNSQRRNCTCSKALFRCSWAPAQNVVHEHCCPYIYIYTHVSMNTLMHICQPTSMQQHYSVSPWKHIMLQRQLLGSLLGSLMFYIEIFRGTASPEHWS